VISVFLFNRVHWKIFNSVQVMGSRLHGAGKRIESIIPAAGEHLDVVTINYYNS